ncbi:type IVB secretion system protein IcmH/DotU [Marinimicrobium agarilyticum]|uniref:type IVB secretion system protein IcmH/DotU n=1 Tax=Marinimicrobium agarilyticum TaxID=306546 RepID=UPI0003F7151B|nr:type IVB secretion system protein IcmH/DotU [Marinimicrobium agarilyticum]
MDSPDKTVFRQPKPGGDRTRMKPSPGARVEPPPRPAEPIAPPPREPVAAQALLPSRGLNPLVSAADTLLAVHSKVRQSARHPDVAGLYRQLTQEIRQFEAKAREQGLPPETVLAARYILCSVLDEAVLNTPWGSDSPWAQRTLLSAFHNETSGGEKFFQILDRMNQAPSQNLDMLELMYLCLSLGFEGRYRLAHRGRDVLEQIKDDVYRTIRRYRGEHERSLSPSWEGLGRTRSTLTEAIPLWVWAAMVALVLVLTYSGFRYWLYTSSSPVVEQLQSVNESIESSSPNAL